VHTQTLKRRAGLFKFARDLGDEPVVLGQAEEKVRPGSEE
jgi:hypothetical protein